MPTRSILRIYDSCLDRLRKNRAQLAMLQLTGRLEDYLTKEFATCVYVKSGGALIALSNVGLSRNHEQKIDLAILDGDFSKKIDRKNATVRSPVEAKYLQNTHKICLGNAKDELSVTLKDLKRQLWSFRKRTQGGFPVALAGRRKDIYGLVFASYVRSENDIDKEDEFLRRIRFLARQHALTYNDFKDYPMLTPVYERVRVKALKRDFRVSLRAGLWRAN